MEVMNSTEFESKDVLVGGAGRVGKHTVNDDPHLMSMLSTSLYANPLRTMIQEVMFNAWDAHRMGNCQDKPIDIYLNDTTGLIVRDYGPGIDPNQIDEIYCTYGASTKRDDPNQTGGFGLGSKSPYAYNDNFMVSNHFDGKKTMYIMRRVHEANDGGPGYDVVVENAKTEERGLLVTVPLKSENDKRRAYKYLKDLLFLSGIKVNIHYERSDEEDETVEAEDLAPGEFITAEHIEFRIYAVYGGVKYEIMEHEEYEMEYNFLRRLAGQFYVGFAPNSLTPLPNREGLNMCERSIESIKSALETIYEHFLSHMIPASKVTMFETLKSAKSSTLQPQFIMYKWKDVGDHTDLKEMVFKEDNVMQRIMDRCPEKMNPSVWKSVAKMSLSETRFMCEMIGYDKFKQMTAVVWAKEFPEQKHWRFRIAATGGLKKQDIWAETRINYAKWLISLQKDIEGITKSEQKPRVKVGSNHQWFILTNQRRAGKFDHLEGRSKDIVAKLDRAKKLKPAAYLEDQLWFQKDGKYFDHTMKIGTIILAKTAAALNKTKINFQKIMVPEYPHTYGYDKWSWNQWCYSSSQKPVAAFIVHKKKGNYDKVKALLESQGIEVIEADEPKPKARPIESAIDAGDEVEVRPEPVGNFVLDVRRSDWASDEEVKKPSTYLYITKTDLRGYNNQYNEGFVSLVQKYAPKMVICHNKARADKLSRQGALEFSERIDYIVEKLLADKERIRIIRLHQLVHAESGLPSEVLRIPEMQKLMGLPYIRTKQLEAFDRDRNFLDRVTQRQNRYSYRRSYEKGVTQDITHKVTMAMDAVDQDPSVALVRRMIKASKAFDCSALRIMCQTMKRDEQKMFAQKIARFLRTV